MIDNSKKYTKLNQRDHIIQRPDTYIGSISNERKILYVAQDFKIKYNEVDFNPGFYTCFNEILTNASDHYIRTGQVKYIKITVEKDHIIIENDGPGVPIEIHKKEKIYIPELVFGNFLTSENYDDSINRTWGGRNGYGAKLTNVFSTKFIVETADGKHKYHQTFTNNMDKKSKPTITKSNKNYTKITFYPDFEKFGLSKIDNDIESIFLKRAIDIAAYSPNVKVYYNDLLIPIKSFKDYMKMFIDDENELFYEKINDNWEIGITKSQTEAFQHVSMVNGISTHNGGTHVNFITNQLVKNIEDKLKNKSIKPNIIKNHLFVFVNCKISNPSFETQTKENLTNRMTSDIIKDVNISDALIKKILSSSIKTDIVNFASFKEFQEAKKSTQNGQKTKVRIAKLDDANKAGKNPDNLKCHLFLTEGDCLHEDTNIVVIRNKKKINIKIKDVNSNDMVITHKNNICLINNISKKIEQAVKITLSNDEILMCSKNHKWYVYDKINNNFQFIKTYKIDINKHKMLINKNAFINDFLEITNIQKIQNKKYKYSILLSNNTEFLSSAKHRFSVFDIIDQKFKMIECQNLNISQHILVSYSKI